mmetsp:Transcript_17817/g.57667  ORF Transcript_17817/g.57667 Transcript_17817/m.57667 type:complete len:133 (-) Transcript_17817:62-460(-)
MAMELGLCGFPAAQQHSRTAKRCSTLRGVIAEDATAQLGCLTVASDSLVGRIPFSFDFRGFPAPFFDTPSSQRRRDEKSMQNRGGNRLAALPAPQAAPTTWRKDERTINLGDFSFDRRDCQQNRFYGRFYVY